MFDIKCTKCKFFNPYECWCEKNQDEENCDFCEEFEEESVDVLELVCNNCKWHYEGACVFDFDSPLNCNRFKMAKDED